MKSNDLENIFSEDLSKELDEYDFYLPDELIAKYPVLPRDHAKLLIVKGHQLIDDYFYNLPKYLEEDSLIVFNNTRVAHRRVFLKFKNKNFEVVFLEKQNQNIWKCLINKGRKIKIHEFLNIDDYQFRLEERDKLFFYLSCWNQNQPYLINFEEEENFFSKYGNIPIPPYLKRKSEEIDRVYYQTIYANKATSVAAPTAGLHFTEELLEKIKTKHKIEYITLDIGYGTFAPLSRENLIENKLHKETYTISQKAANILNEFKHKKKIICVGTTTLRALEDNFRKHNKFLAGKFETELFIKPPDKVISVDALITNFHLPKSSLLLLVSAFAGKNIIKNTYQYAIKHNYHFYSYGDGMLLFKN